jgi:hypothetical protein
MQKKLLATLVASAFAGAAGVATAGPISVASIGVYAVEAMGTAVTVNVGNVAYSLSNPFAISSTQTVRYTLDSSIDVVGNCPTVTLTPAVVGVTIGAASLSTDKLSCSYTVTTGANPVALPATVNFANAKALSGPLAVTGGKINATVSVLSAGGALVETNSAAVAESAEAFTASIVSSAALSPLPERSRVDVTTSPTPGIEFTAETTATDVTAPSTKVVNLGRVRVTETAGVQLFSDGTTNVGFTAATIEALTVNVSGPFLVKTGTTLTLNDKASCAGADLQTITGPSATAANKFGPFSIDTLAALDGNKDVHICYTVPGTAAIPTGQFTANATFDPGITLATDLTDEVIATTNIYNLLLNGVQIDIRNYVPAGAFGWFSAYRIINTGAVPAAVTGQFISPDGALLGSALPITGSIPVGGVRVLNATDVEGVLGAATAPAGVGPRLRLTAPTDSLRVQSFACQPSGNCFLNSDSQGADAGGSDK